MLYPVLKFDKPAGKEYGQQGSSLGTLFSVFLKFFRLPDISPLFSTLQNCLRISPWVLGVAVKRKAERTIVVQRRSYSNHRPAPPQYGQNGKPAPRLPKDTDRSTHCESNYLHALMNEGRELVFVLQQNERITGLLAWYDESCLKVAPSNGGPSLILPKRSIKYLYELRESEVTRRRAKDKEATNGTNSLV